MLSPVEFPSIETKDTFNFYITVLEVHFLFNGKEVLSMRTRVLNKIIGRFLQLYSLVLLLPILAGLYYSEPFYNLLGFLVASLVSAMLGTALSYENPSSKPSVIEGITATVLGWVLAVILGSIPLLVEMNMVNAIFEAAAGLTTTGISMLLDPSRLPKSLLFWRGLMQWIGGLGILTFFIAVLRESGGVTRQLYSAESHKTDSGSIRPSLKKSISELWRVYGFISMLFIGAYIALGMPLFDSLMHVFSGISTGGFSTKAGSIGAFGSVNIEIATVALMFIGGVNFVLLYKFLEADVRSLLKNSEFRFYTGFFLLASILVGWELFSGGQNLFSSILDGAFQSAAVVSSTGYSTMSITSLSIFLQSLFLGLMFVGGSLGSTAGGWKMFRLRAMIEALKTKLRSYTLPESAVNRPKMDGEILADSTVKTISVLFFAWVIMIFAGSLTVLLFDEVSFMAALSGSISSAGNMGPVYMAGEELVGLSVPSKMGWMVLMLAGRLEMLPVLAIFNSELFKDSK